MSNKKLLVVNKRYTSKTEYVNYKEIGSYLWNKDLDDLIFIYIDSDNNVEIIIKIESNNIRKIQNLINLYYGEDSCS